MIRRLQQRVYRRVPPPDRFFAPNRCRRKPKRIAPNSWWKARKLRARRERRKQGTKL